MSLVSNLACPTCERELKQPGIRLQSAFGQFAMFCVNGHRFPDTEELMALKPTNLPPLAAPVKAPPVTPQLTVTVQVPDFVEKQLRERFKDRYSDTIASILREMSIEPAFVVPAEDVQRIATQAGQKVSDSAGVVGLLFAMKQSVAAAEEKAKLATASAGAAGVPLANGEVEIKLRLPQGVFQQIEEKATFNAMDSASYMRNMVLHALLNGWL